MRQKISENVSREINIEYLKSAAGTITESFIGIYDIGDKQTCENIIEQVDNLWKEKEEQENNKEWIPERKRKGIAFESPHSNTMPTSSRQDRALFIEDSQYTPDIKKFNEWLQIAFDLYTERFDINHQMFSNTNKIHQVEPFNNGYAVLHYEAADGESAGRCLTWMMPLNDVERGGETEWPTYGIRQKPKAGRIIIWPAAYTHFHRGLVPYERKCYITGWFYGQGHENNVESMKKE